ncbi:MAG: hypothetical protein HFI77_08475 [Lachnospiraceae bacterium]|nr:hypothetical protein [Lachnospiraceae bacterium]
MRIDGNQNPYRAKEEEKVREMQKNATAEPLEEKKRLMSKLAQVETELSQKDNDGYRKANASVSNE